LELAETSLRQRLKANREPRKNCAQRDPYDREISAYNVVCKTSFVTSVEHLPPGRAKDNAPPRFIPIRSSPRSVTAPSSVRRSITRCVSFSKLARSCTCAIVHHDASDFYDSTVSTISFDAYISTDLVPKDEGTILDSISDDK